MMIGDISRPKAYFLDAFCISLSVATIIFCLWLLTEI